MLLNSDSTQVEDNWISGLSKTIMPQQLQKFSLHYHHSLNAFK